MRVRDFVASFEQNLKNIANNNLSDDTEISKESAKTIDDLRFLCEWVSKSGNSGVPACKETLYPFIEFLAERSVFLSKELPHGHYTSSVVTDANRACVELAKALSACIHKGAQRHRPLEFLLPKVKTDAATEVQFLQRPHDFSLNEAATELTKVAYIKENVYTIASALTCKDLNVLISALGVLPCGSRLGYLSSFPLPVMSALLLNGKKFSAALNEHERFVCNEEQARNILMAFGYYYSELTRTRTDNYNRYSASYTGYDKAIKLKGISLVLEFLESDQRLSKFEEYLNTDVFKEIVSTSMFGSYTLKDAVLQGELGEFCKMIMHVSKPENREPVKPSESWFGFGNRS